MNTEPIKYKKFSRTVAFDITAIDAPITETSMAAVFSFISFVILVVLTPAEYTSRYVVVMVEKIIISMAIVPAPAFDSIIDMSLSPVKIAAAMPIMYIQLLVSIYVEALIAEAAMPFFDFLV